MSTAEQAVCHSVATHLVHIARIRAAQQQYPHDFDVAVQRSDAQRRPPLCTQTEAASVQKLQLPHKPTYGGRHSTSFGLVQR
jgi:hypothetical protein